MVLYTFRDKDKSDGKNYITVRSWSKIGLTDYSYYGLDQVSMGHIQIPLAA